MWEKDGKINRIFSVPFSWTRKRRIAFGVFRHVGLRSRQTYFCVFIFAISATYTIDASKKHPLLALFGFRRKRSLQVLHFYKRFYILRSSFLYSRSYLTWFISVLAQKIIAIQTWEVNAKSNKMWNLVIWSFYFFLWCYGVISTYWILFSFCSRVQVVYLENNLLYLSIYKILDIFNIFLTKITGWTGTYRTTIYIKLHRLIIIAIMIGT